MKNRTLSALTSAVLVAAVPLLSLGTGIPVVDVAAIGKLVQNGLTETQQLAQQIQTARNTLDTYVLAAKQATGLGEVARIYQQYQQTMQQLQSLYGQFANDGSLQNYLQQFQNVQYWEQVSPQNYAQAASSSWDQNSQTQKQYNDAWAQSLAQHQQLLQSDAANLQRAQGSAQSADSMLAEMQANAQINAAMANQLLQIHALLVQEQQALQARQASQANDEALRKAASEAYARPTYQPSSQDSFEP